ncbi:XkdX family protein [Clostridium novyi]|nr:XkdX family protein [Clostridium novyi]
MFNFYKMFYGTALTKEDMQEACKWGCVTVEEYKKIVGEEYTGELM